MEGSKPQRINAIVPAVLRRAKTQQRALTTIQRKWAGLVGRSLARHSRPVSLRGGRLVVHVEQPGDSFALSYQRETLLERLSAGTAGRIEELVIRPGALERRASRRPQAGECRT